MRYITKSELYTLLEGYGVNPTSFKNLHLCRQIFDIGIYDPASVPKGGQVEVRTLRERFAHEIWGFLEKRKRGNGTGAGDIPFYSLRPDWQSRRFGYPPLFASRLDNEELVKAILFARMKFSTQQAAEKNDTLTIRALKNEYKKRRRTGWVDINYESLFNNPPSTFRK